LCRLLRTGSSWSPKQPQKQQDKERISELQQQLADTAIQLSAAESLVHDLQQQLCQQGTKAATTATQASPAAQVADAMHDLAEQLAKAMECLIKRGEMGTLAQQELLDLLKVSVATAQVEQQQQGPSHHSEEHAWVEKGLTASPGAANGKGCLQSHPLAVSVSVSSVFDGSLLRQSQHVEAGKAANAKDDQRGVPSHAQGALWSADSRAEVATMQEVSKQDLAPVTIDYKLPQTSATSCRSAWDTLVLLKQPPCHLQIL
jgi:hypothetical protein